MQDRINDFIPAIQMYNQPRQNREHNRVIRDLIAGLRMLDYTVLNYDHVTLSLPKYPIDLNLEGKRYDIVAWHDNVLVYIEVKVRRCKFSELIEMMKDGKG